MTLALMLMLAMTMTVTMGRAEIAASSVGSGFYEACLAFHTTTNKVSWLQHMIIMEMPTLKTIILRTICYEIA